MRKFAILPALALLLLTAHTYGQNNNNTIRGKVRSSNNTPINNAIVELRANGGPMLGQTATRGDGDFTFANLVAGEYEVEVYLAGYESKVQTVRFNHGARSNFQEVLHVEIIIHPKSEGQTSGPPATNFVQDVPKAARAFYEKAMARLREGKSQEAVGLLREATTAFKDYFHAHLALGNELYRTGKYDEAIQSLEQARRINDREGAVYYLFGLVMVKQRKFVVAEYAFRQALNLNANHAGAHFHRGLTLIEIGFRSEKSQRETELAEAEKELGRAFELSAGRLSEVYLQRARIYESRGEREAAAREFEAFLKAEPNAKNAAAVREAITKLRGEKK
ncbi:MAG: carboxypeptidase regulatory-like domain-containing protein [Acidobacteriota bacterium]